MCAACQGVADWMEESQVAERSQQASAYPLPYPEAPGDDEDTDIDHAEISTDCGVYANQSVLTLITKAASSADFQERYGESDNGSDGKMQQDKADGLGLSNAVAVSMKEHAKDTLEHSAVIAREVVDALEEPTSQSIQTPSTVNKSSRGQVWIHKPVTSQTLEATANLYPSDSPSRSDKMASGHEHQELEKESNTMLADQLKTIFGFQSCEKVIADFACWLTQDILFQGHMYITQRHVCFYAYVPDRIGIIIKSGYLAKRGKQNPTYSRYWFQLKGHELSYRTDSSDLYFRSGSIDLRCGVSAALREAKDSHQTTKEFCIVTPEREYQLRANSTSSAREWVKQIQQVIFRIHNKGDSVKISMSITDIIDVEEAPIIEVAKTIRIRVANADESLLVFALEDYFFTFFGDGKSAHTILNGVVRANVTHQLSRAKSGSSDTDDNPGLHEPCQVPLPLGKWGHEDQTQDFLEFSADIMRREPVRAILRRSMSIGSGPTSPKASDEWIANCPRQGPNVGRRRIDIHYDGISSPGREARQAFLNSGGEAPQTGHFGSTKQSKNDSASQGSFGESTAPWHQRPRFQDDSTGNCGLIGDVEISSSHFLDRSDMFQSPTIRRGDPSHNPNGQSNELVTNPLALSGKFRSPPCTESSEAGNGGSHRSNGNLILQQAVTATGFPLRKAARLADYVRERSKRMSNLLASESIGYVEKVSGMLAGGRKHYDGTEILMGDNTSGMSQTEYQCDDSGDRFRAYFALAPSERLRAVYSTYLHRGIPLYGKLYLSDRKVCFRSLMTQTKMVLPFKDIETVSKEKGFRFGYCGLVVVVRGHEELFFDFRSHEARDDCTITILRSLNNTRALMESGVLSQKDQEEAQTTKNEHRRLLEASNFNKAPVLFDDPRASVLDFKPTVSLRITCLTIGSRGDVQPYIALCKGLLRDGHKPKIATHLEFGGWIKGHGIDFAPIDGDPAELMRICVENGMFTYSFLKEASAKFRGWIDGLLTSAWKACQNTDLLIESPSAMAGAHIAEALAIPYFKAFTMPWTRTRAYPHAFAIPAQKRGGTYNELSYYIFDQVFWKAIAGQVNRWREKELGLRRTDLARMSPHRVPFLYNFSPCVVVPPLDFSDWVHVTGYWVLDEAADWEPSRDLVDFIAKARADDKKLVYIGFGSIVVSDPATLTKTVVDSVLKADVRCILSKGWSDRLGTSDAMLTEIPLPPEILQIRSVPHDWLFMHMDAAAHHGGAGTTGASLRAGLPTIIKPFFGDQHFFGSRVDDLGVGICLKKMNTSLFSRALWEVTRNLRMITKAAALGERIRDEDGVGTAIQTIYRDLDYARSLIKHPDQMTSKENLFDEDWTLIGDEDDPELVRRKQTSESNVSASEASVGLSRRQESPDLGA